MADFKTSYLHTLSIEGGYVNDPNDKGGETYKGIARNFHKDWKGWSIIDDSKKNHNFPNCLNSNTTLQSLVALFYKEKFWDVLKLDAVSSQELANELFDTSVNLHWKRAGRWLQRSLNLLNRDEKDYEDLLVDGLVGRKTLKALDNYLDTQRFSSRNKDKNVKVLLKLLNYFQIKKYVDNTEEDKSFEKYIYGWIINRT